MSKVLINLLDPGYIVTTADNHKYKVYIELEGLYLEDMLYPKSFLDLKLYNNKLEYADWPLKDITSITNPRTKKTFKVQKKATSQ